MTGPALLVDQRQPRGQRGEGPIGPPPIRDTKLNGLTIRLIPVSEPRNRRPLMRKSIIGGLGVGSGMAIFLAFSRRQAE